MWTFGLPLVAYVAGGSGEPAFSFLHLKVSIRLRAEKITKELRTGLRMTLSMENRHTAGATSHFLVGWGHHLWATKEQRWVQKLDKEMVPIQRKSSVLALGTRLKPHMEAKPEWRGEEQGCGKPDAHWEARVGKVKTKPGSRKAINSYSATESFPKHSIKEKKILSKGHTTYQLHPKGVTV